ncbi:MAG: spermidine/putrescine ABC transporter ATP-binding protein [Acidiferrobacteraceae bacterium]|jgi:putative spermidine/putrescine transport system ATP-binding protein|nr:spermidine/putrescine ABC transporter ATP-binding protein [Acidiferrobacteraceae bacterium]MDP6435457.1 ABC transporter ATP-binding protein [Arenicellales bacterium]MDP6672431.1 ABC transporter ATP-binding protein [Arenicellales bacterium]MDP6723702.1 ABC transporter ATP-binding protein [Arenicellales bacterium]|tara:strand:- start:11142 stop:12242 length:1101 start_codon:yes stop_codon:yes gene_type:complete
MGTENTSYVQFKDIQKSYDGETLVIKGLNLDVACGEFLTLLGPSGSGKTTCLMMLAGFETATHGEIILDSQAINNVPPHHRDIGMVFQNYALFPHMTVAENLAFPLQVRKIEKTEITRRVQNALEMVQLGQFGNRMPGQLSGGQQQRVAVARALVFEPKLVLMDEPLGALDKQLREQMQYEIKHLHEQLGITIVYVTHDQTEALTMSNRIAVFNDGVIQQLAPPDVLYEKPENAFVAQFIGENNRLLGTLTETTDDTSCSVRLDSGEVIKALPINIGKTGDRSQISLRPERVFINTTAENCTNQVRGAVEELIYHGDHIRARINVCGHDDFIVKVPNSASHSLMQTGESVTLGWQVEDCRALDDLA